MSLIFCRECGVKVSEFARSCNNCGYPIQNYNNQKSEVETAKQNNSVWIIIGYLTPFLGLFLHPIFALVAIFIGCFNIIKGNYVHGLIQIVISILLGIFGVFVNLFLFIL